MGAGITAPFFMEEDKKTQRVIIGSKEQKEAGETRIVSPAPTDRADCECHGMVAAMKQGEEIKHITCPRAKEEGMEKYKIVCGECGADIAFIHATDKRLSDWCNLHYICEFDGEKWEGCMTVNISPVDETLGFECSCGNDTRDFRANTTLPNELRKKIVKENSEGKKFGYKNSKFILKEIK